MSAEQAIAALRDALDGGDVAPARRALGLARVYAADRDDEIEQMIAEYPELEVEAAPPALGDPFGLEGQPLPGDLRARFEASLGADLSGVRVHDDPAGADAIDATAYALGSDVFMGADAPSSGAERELVLAHEVAHTVQQDGADPSQPVEIGATDDAAEDDADMAAAAMVAGAPARVAHDGGPVRRLRRLPRITWRRHGRGFAFGLQRSSWRIDWQRLHARLAAMPDYAHYARAFTAQDLNDTRDHNVVSRPLVLPDGRTVTLDLTSMRATVRHGQTQQLGPGHVRSEFNAAADLNDLLGENPSIADAQAMNSDRGRLQQRLDDQVFEVLVHELAHATIFFEGEAPGASAHSGPFVRMQALERGASSSDAAAAEHQMFVELLQRMSQVVADNVAERNRAAVLARVRARPALQPAAVRAWLLRERAAYDASDPLGTTPASNQLLAAGYGGTLVDHVLAGMRDADPTAGRSRGGSNALVARIEAWLDAVVRNAGGGSAPSGASGSAAPPASAPAIVPRTSP